MLSWLLLFRSCEMKSGVWECSDNAKMRYFGLGGNGNALMCASSMQECRIIPWSVVSGKGLVDNSWWSFYFWIKIFFQISWMNTLLILVLRLHIYLSERSQEWYIYCWSLSLIFCWWLRWKQRIFCIFNFMQWNCNNFYSFNSTNIRTACIVIQFDYGHIVVLSVLQ